MDYADEGATGMSYTVLYNVPGTLPEMEPFEVASASDAVMALCTEIERYGMEHEDDAVASEAFSLVSELESNQTEWEGRVRTSGTLSFAIGKYVFEVSRAASRTNT